MTWNWNFTVFAGVSWLADASVRVVVWRVLAFGLVLAIETVVGARNWLVAGRSGVKIVACAGLKTG